MSNKSICLPFASEAQYRDSVDYPTQYRQYLIRMLAQHPALFPKAMDQGFTLLGGFTTDAVYWPGTVRRRGSGDILAIALRCSVLQLSQRDSDCRHCDRSLVRGADLYCLHLAPGF